MKVSKKHPCMVYLPTFTVIYHMYKNNIWTPNWMYESLQRNHRNKYTSPMDGMGFIYIYIYIWTLNVWTSSKNIQCYNKHPTRPTFLCHFVRSNRCRISFDTPPNLTLDIKHTIRCRWRGGASLRMARMNKMEVTCGTLRNRKKSGEMQVNGI